MLQSAANDDAGSKPDGGSETSLPDAIVCRPQADGKVLLATGLKSPSFVGAPPGPNDPVVVRDDQHYRFIDPQTCEERGTLSLSERASPPLALGDWAAFRDRDVWLVNLVTREEIRAMPRGTPVAIHADSQWLYLLSAVLDEMWEIGTNETVAELFIERVPRTDLARARTPESLQSLDLEGMEMWNHVWVIGSASQMIVTFGYLQLDVNGPFTAFQLHLDSLKTRYLFGGEYRKAVALEDAVLFQWTNQLWFDSETEFRLLRQDLDHLTLRGAVPGHAIAFDGWFERPLLALPLDGSAPRELSKDVPTGDAVSAARGRVYWSTSAGELWMMTP